MQVYIAMAISVINTGLIVLDLIPGNQGESVLRQILAYLKKLSG